MICEIFVYIGWIKDGRVFYRKDIYFILNRMVKMYVDRNVRIKVKWQCANSGSVILHIHCLLFLCRILYCKVERESGLCGLVFQSLLVAHFQLGSANLRHWKKIGGQQEGRNQSIIKIIYLFILTLSQIPS